MLMNSCIPIIMEICILFPLIKLLTYKGHFLMSLLYLESIMLAIVILLPTAMIALSAQATFVSIVLLSVGVCEASIGLALLVRMTRSYGNDMISMISLTKC